MKIVDKVKDWFSKDTNSTNVEKLTQDQQELLHELVLRDAPLYEIASALEISDARAKYERNKVGVSQDR